MSRSRVLFAVHSGEVLVGGLPSEAPGVAPSTFPDCEQNRPSQGVGPYGCIGESKPTPIPVRQPKDTRAMWYASTDAATAPYLEGGPFGFHRSAWPHSTIPRIEPPTPIWLAPDSFLYNAMPSTSVPDPADRSSIALATRVPSNGGLRSNRTRNAHGCASSIGLILPSSPEPQSNEHDWTSGSSRPATRRAMKVLS